jgi:signal transduction histidine kinase
MAHPRLAEFIRENIEAILQAWEDFARTVEPPALTMDDVELRDHARQMLLEIVTDLDKPQSERQRSDKSKGQGGREAKDSAAETHAQARLLSGFTVVQLVSEYRALRSSVLTLWDSKTGDEVIAHTPDAADISRFNEAIDQALTESVARYEHLIRQSQNMFLAILGHDLRNPLGSVVMGASFLMQAPDIAPRYALTATRMFSSAKRMSSLVNDLIDFTRSHLGAGIPVSVRHGDLAVVCRQVAEELRTFHPERQIELSTPPTLTAVFDDGRIAQMLSNLVGNAIQYGIAEAPVTVDLHLNGGEMIIVVTNRGPVIPVDRIAGVFDPLVRAAQSSGADAAEHTSLGIGLYIAREIAQAHGGRIVAESNEADGTTFTVCLPRRTIIPTDL